MKRIILLLLFTSFLGFSTYSQSITLDPSASIPVETKKSAAYNKLTISSGVGYGGYLFYNETDSQIGGLWYHRAEDAMNLTGAGFTTPGFVFKRTNNKMGIGTFNPEGKLDIFYNSGIADPTLRLTENSTTDGSRLTFGNNNPSYFTLYGNPSATAANGIFNLYHSSAGNVMSWKGDGNVGIGTTAPATKLHVTTGGVTIDHDNSATDVINFKLNNPISAAGIKFNSSAGSLLGGYLHGQTRSHLFRGSNSNEGLTINSDNYVGLNNSSPTVPLHVNHNEGNTNSTNGAMIIGGLGLVHSTAVGNQINSWSGTSGTDYYINFYSNSKVHIGNGPTGAGLDVNGFTNLGDGAPSIKMKKLTGTTDSDSQTNVAHGLDWTKILDVSVFINNSSNFAKYPPQENSGSTFEYRMFVNTIDIGLANVSTGLQGNLYTILITYEE